jgi:hypothetical protein
VTASDGSNSSNDTERVRFFFFLSLCVSFKEAKTNPQRERESKRVRESKRGG